MMMRSVDAVSYEAFVRLLARPDPRDLPRRAHVMRYKGDPDRRTTRLHPILMGWLQRHYLEVDVEPPLAKARTWKPRGRSANPGLRVLRPTGTG
jgi:hypothetical protein